LLLQGLGGCTAFDVMMILKKARQPVTDCVLEIEAQRADTEPKVFTKIHIHFIVTGSGVSEKHVKRAIDLSAEKYCSASIMLGQVAEITHDFELCEG
jgi:putative redox protein